MILNKMLACLIDRCDWVGDNYDMGKRERELGMQMVLSLVSVDVILMYEVRSLKD